MAVKLRLSRGGAKKRPYYYIVAADVRTPRDGRYIERVGTFNPMVPKDHADRLKLNEERCKYWLSVGALPSDRVARFLDAAGLFKRVPSVNPEKAKPKKKAQERLAAAEEKAKEAEEAKNAPAEEPAAEAPAEEPAAETPAEAPAEASGDEMPAEAAGDEKAAEESGDEKAEASE